MTIMFLDSILKRYLPASVGPGGRFYMFFRRCPRPDLFWSRAKPIDRVVWENTKCSRLRMFPVYDLGLLSRLWGVPMVSIARISTENDIYLHDSNMVISRSNPYAENWADGGVGVEEKDFDKLKKLVDARKRRCEKMGWPIEQV